jgi:hypothetical protein
VGHDEPIFFPSASFCAAALITAGEQTMPSERIQRQIDQLLDEAEQAVRESNWALVRSRAEETGDEPR